MNKLYIKSVEYACADGITIVDKKSEDLDVGNVEVPFQPKMSLEPYDDVEVVIGTNHYYFVIDAWVEEISSYNPMTYNYNINLVSETIKLQKIILPNKSHRKTLAHSNISIAEELRRLYELYITPQFPELTLSNEILALSDECPEFKLLRPTMFEVFNHLLSTINKCVTIRNHVISFIDLAEYGTSINETKLSSSTDTQLIKEYANRLDIQVDNAVSTLNNYQSFSGVSIRADNGYVLNEDNMAIVLDKPIYDISTLKLYVYLRIIRGSQATYIDPEELTTLQSVKLDITKYIHEKKVYDTLKVTDATTETGLDYKRNALYFSMGDNKILGLSYNEATWFIGINSNVAIWNIIMAEIDANYNQDGNPDTYVPYFLPKDIRKNVFFKAEYKSNDTFRLNVLKDSTHNATMVDNQTEKLVDANSFGKVEQDKLNRLGNSQKTIYAIYDNLSDIPALGDYIDRYVLAERNIVYFNDYAVFRGVLYKDFIRKNLYYGLASKKRYTQLVDEAIDRNEIFNYELKFTKTDPQYNYFDNKRQLTRYALMPFNSMNYSGDCYDEFPKYMTLAFYADAEKTINLINKDGVSGRGLIGTTSYSAGRTSVIHGSVQDNYSVGIRWGEDAIGGTMQRWVSYVDENGEANNVDVVIETNNEDDMIEAMEDYSQIRVLTFDFPFLSNEDGSQGGLLVQDSKTIYKDNAEKMSFTFNFMSVGSEDVYVGSNIAYYLGFNLHNKATGLHIVASATEKYDEGDELGLGEIQQSAYIVPTNLKNGMDTAPAPLNFIAPDSITIYLEGYWKSWGIVNDNNELVIGVNAEEGSNVPYTIYLEVNKKPY